MNNNNNKNKRRNKNNNAINPFTALGTGDSDDDDDDDANNGTGIDSVQAPLLSIIPPFSLFAPASFSINPNKKITVTQTPPTTPASGLHHQQQPPLQSCLFGIHKENNYDDDDPDPDL
mmetsp:Transcript_15856/g.17118  ORF Transcript_15856/g.17118 Transcript_15856/m.17118 type:complete len:118 (+) Transcript_15856:123-476(+)